MTRRRLSFQALLLSVLMCAGDRKDVYYRPSESSALIEVRHSAGPSNWKAYILFFLISAILALALNFNKYKWWIFGLIAVLALLVFKHFIF